MPLSPKQARFVDEYMIDLNATQAAIRAGYSAKSAHVNGPRLLGHASVKSEIARRKAEAKPVGEVTREWVIAGLTKIAKRCSARGTFNAAGATRAYELLGKHIGMFTEQVEVGIKGSLLIIEEIAE